MEKVPATTIGPRLLSLARRLGSVRPTRAVALMGVTALSMSLAVPMTLAYANDDDRDGNGHEQEDRRHDDDDRDDKNSRNLDARLKAELQRVGFTGRSNRRWRRAWGARSTRSSPISAGCCGSTPSAACTTTTPAPAAIRRPPGFGDTQSIAIGVQNNGLVGPNRTGPRNQRRTPTVVNTAFYPEADVERPLLGAVGRSVRQRAGLPVSAARRRDRVPAERSDRHAPADRAGAHPADRAGRGGRLHRHRGHDRAALRSVRRRRAARCRRPMRRGFRNEPIRQACSSA